MRYGALLLAIGTGLALLWGGACRGPAPGADGPMVLRQAFPTADGLQPMPLPASRPAAVTSAWIVRQANAAAGYGLRLHGRTRSGRFQAFLVLGPDLAVRQVNVERYVGDRGGAIRRSAFEDQFRGKTPLSDLRIGHDIDAVTGATISSRALTRAVREGTRWLHARQAQQAQER